VYTEVNADSEYAKWVDETKASAQWKILIFWFSFKQRDNAVAVFPLPPFAE
jgi:hypothetical protein